MVEEVDTDVGAGEPFEDERPAYFGTHPDRLLLDIDGFEGPIDVLLTLARDQKVDLTRISILALADQYLGFISRARQLRLDLAADYLVMAAWLAYLKSRLLLPAPSEDEEPSGPEMAAMLAFHLQRLEAMQQAGAGLMDRPRLGRDIFARGAPEPVGVVSRPSFEITLYDVLKAYARQYLRQEGSTLHIAPTELYSIEDAIARLRSLIGSVPDWTTLSRFLPSGIRDTLLYRSAVASTFVAMLELVRSGRVELRQEEPFTPVYVRAGREGR